MVILNTALKVSIITQFTAIPPNHMKPNSFENVISFLLLSMIIPMDLFKNLKLVYVYFLVKEIRQIHIIVTPNEVCLSSQADHIVHVEYRPNYYYNYSY